MSSTPALPVSAGLDGRRASLAAADWAAREALLRDVPLRLVHAWEQPIVPLASLAQAAVPPDPERSASLLAEARAYLTRRHPGLEVTTDRLTGDPVAALVAAADESGLLVLGSRGLGRTAGFLLGSVARSVVARAGRPVVLVRSPEPAAEEDGTDARATDDSGTRAAPGDVVVGVDLDGPDDAVLAYAFEAAALRGAGLRIVHGHGPVDGEGTGAVGPADGLADGDALAVPAEGPLAQALRPWQEKFPGVPVTAQASIGQAGSHLAEASKDAALLVVGRAARQAPVGAHIGPVTDAVLRHAQSPVAVVPHD
ncbi:universal stress protein [Streptomyces naganishii]|uniref:Stress-inducible protein n=1 Tax=Streptomyces naganishii JCM 4654 TaxID=1306179 RepID=A0A918YBW0_9ACTN|nr:universal stress protein [Streptomyces naganishii]GHD97210.1 stress-inducible protein [Streptomyces naganishii JCM 4654]